MLIAIADPLGTAKAPTTPELMHVAGTGVQAVFRQCLEAHGSDLGYVLAAVHVHKLGSSRPKHVHHLPIVVIPYEPEQRAQRTTENLACPQ